MNIRAWRRLAAPLLLSLSLGWGAAWSEPSRGEFGIPNLGVIKEEIKAYHDSGAYDKEIKTVTDRARQYLEENLPRYGGQKSAIVFDIDETSLSNYPSIKDSDFGFISSAWNAWVDKGEAPAIQGCLELYQLARQKGMEVFFLSGRSEPQRASTARNLQKAGYTAYTSLILKGPEHKNMTTGDYKVIERRRIIEKGYHIVVNIGDQASDLSGGYAEATFKLPNPMYFVP